jgi:hypothetical protein
VPGNLAKDCALQDGVRSQLGTIVADDDPGLATLDQEAIELTRDPYAGDRGIGDERQALVCGWTAPQKCVRLACKSLPFKTSP